MSVLLALRLGAARIVAEAGGGEVPRLPVPAMAPEAYAVLRERFVTMLTEEGD